MNGLIRAVLPALLVLTQHREAHAQPSDLSRLRQVIAKRQAHGDFSRDTSYIDALDSLAFGYYRISPDSVLLYSKQALAYANTAGYRKGQSASLRIMGNGYRLVGDYVNMLSSYHRALDIAEEIDNPLSIAKTEINIALFYIETGKYEESLALLGNAAQILEKTGDSMNLNKAISGIADIWLRKKEYDKALLYDQQALAIAIAMKNDYLVVTNRNFISEILLAKGRYKEALANYLHALDYFNHTDDNIRKAMTASDVAKTCFLLKDYPQALTYAQQSLAIASDMKAKSQALTALKVLADTYEAKGDFRNALRYSRLHKRLSDSLFNEDMRRKTEEMAASYEYEKEEKQARERQAGKEALHRQAILKNRLEISIGALVILFLGVLSIVLFRSRARKQHTNGLLEAKNEEINRQKNELEHLAAQFLLNNQQKDLLFGIIAHDLRAPLYSLSEVMGLLKERSIPETQIRKIIQELRPDVDYSAELVNNLLFWARNQLNGISPDPVGLNLRDLVNDTLPLFRKQADAKDIRLHNELGPGLSGYADRNMTEVVVRNLLSNAVKFCRPGDTITIRGKRLSDTLEICVADTGIGIETTVLEKIQRKENISFPGTAGEKGTGLGLLLCREFIGKNKGLFRVESQRGQGSVFYFTLPAVSAT